MKRALPLLLALAPVAAAAAEPYPAFKDVCTALPKPGSPTSINKKRLLTLVLEKEKGILTLDLDASGDGITYKQKVDAVLDPDAFCRKEGKCSKEAVDKLKKASEFLVAFLFRNVEEPPAGSSGYWVSGPGGQEQTLEQFLRTGGGRALCVDNKTQPGSVAETEPPKRPDGAPTNKQFFSLRKNVTDLKYDQSNPKFKGLDPASVSLTNDYVAEKLSFNIDAAAGYVFHGTDDENIYYDLIPFLLYKQQYVDTALKDTEIFNIGGGIIASFDFRALDMWHSLQIFPKYVYSISTEASVLSGNISYIPPPILPGQGSMRYLIDEYLAYQLYPQINFAFYNVLDPGSDPTLATASNFYRIGPRLALTLFTENLKDIWDLNATLSFNISYEYGWLIDGPISSVEKFEAAFNYGFGDPSLVSLQVKYTTGRDFDTLQKQQVLAVGLGLKY